MIRVWRREILGTMATGLRPSEGLDGGLLILRCCLFDVLAGEDVRVREPVREGFGFVMANGCGVTGL